MCEAFGAYGWNEGLKMMKWIADHLLVRGINYLVPHAFDPKKFRILTARRIFMHMDIIRSSVILRCSAIM